MFGKHSARARAKVRVKSLVHLKMLGAIPRTPKVTAVLTPYGTASSSSVRR